MEPDGRFAERTCPRCAQRMRLPAGRVGFVRCPACDGRFEADTRGAAASGPPDDDVRELQVVQGSAEWLELRRTLRMASETPAVMGLSRYQTQRHVRDAKRGVRGFSNAAMRTGHREEPIARAAYCARYADARPAFFVAGSYGCSLDGISPDHSTVLEVKTLVKGARDARWSLFAAGHATPDFAAQIQHQLMVTRARRAHLWVWDPIAQRGVLVEIGPDPEFWGRIRAAWDAFWPTIA